MPVQHLGQLKPSMQEQIALQRALLALQREDEQIRMKTMPQTAQPALARGLGGGTRAYAGPTSAFAAEKAPTSVTPSHFRPGAGSLQEALRAAQPTEGYVSGEERSRLYEEKMAGEREALAGDAGEFWKRMESLDDEGKKIALDACRKHQPDLYRAMVEQGYVDKATGGAVGLKKEKKVINVSQWTDESGWLNQTTVFEDGTTETEIIGRGAKEAAEGASPSDLIAMQRLGLDMAKYNSSLMETAFKLAGDVPREGLDMVTDEDGNKRVATVQDEAIGLNRVTQIYNTLVATGGLEGEVVKGEATMSDVEREFNASSAEGKMAMQAKLGVPQTGEWDEATAFAMETYGEILLGEKEPVKKPERESNIKTGGGLSEL